MHFTFAHANISSQPYLQGAASSERQFDRFLNLSVARDLAGAVAVVVGVHDAEEGLLELECHIHVSGGAV